MDLGYEVWHSEPAKQMLLVCLVVRTNVSAIRLREDTTLVLAGGHGLENGLLHPFVMAGKHRKLRVLRAHLQLRSALASINFAFFYLKSRRTVIDMVTEHGGMNLKVEYERLRAQIVLMCNADRASIRIQGIL